MSSNKDLITYQHVGCKVRWEYKSVLHNDVDIIKITDAYKEIGQCFGEKQYIQSFIEAIKTRVIKNLPDLSKVRIALGIFDKNNILHKLLIKTYSMLADILKITQKLDLYNTIFAIVLYDNKVVFTGSLEFGKRR